MKQIEYTKNVYDSIIGLNNTEVDIRFDGFGYIISQNDKKITFYNTDELAESINGRDESIVLTSKIENTLENANHKKVKTGVINRIYSVETILTFSKSNPIGIVQRVKDFLNGLKSKTSWKLFKIIFSKTKSGYSSYCINPKNYNLHKGYPSNYVKCGFLIEFADNTCLPLFSNQNSIFMMEFNNETVDSFRNEWNENYDFQLTTASS